MTKPEYAPSKYTLPSETVSQWCPLTGGAESVENGSEEVDHRRAQQGGNHDARRSKERAQAHHEQITEDDAERDSERSECGQGVETGKRRRQQSAHGQANEACTENPIEPALTQKN